MKYTIFDAGVTAPATRVGDPRWRECEQLRAIAGRLADGYRWIDCGRGGRMLADIEALLAIIGYGREADR